jgi:hypothetical protein
MPASRPLRPVAVAPGQASRQLVVLPGLLVLA